MFLYNPSCLPHIPLRPGFREQCSQAFATMVSFVLVLRFCFSVFPPLSGGGSAEPSEAQSLLELPILTNLLFIIKEPPCHLFSCLDELLLVNKEGPAATSWQLNNHRLSPLDLSLCTTVLVACKASQCLPFLTEYHKTQLFKQIHFTKTEAKGSRINIYVKICDITPHTHTHTGLKAHLCNSDHQNE